MLRVLFQKLQENSASLVTLTLQAVNPSEIQVRLVEAGRHADALLELSDGLIRR